MLLIFTPGGFEELLRATSRPADSRTLPPAGEDTAPSDEEIQQMQAAIQVHGCASCLNEQTRARRVRRHERKETADFFPVLRGGSRAPCDDALMPEFSTLLLFAAASAVLVAVPGPAVIYIVTRGVAQGRPAGIVSALGVEAGALVHVAAAVAGLSTLVASSATAFSAVKYAGAGYLLFLGIQKLRARAELSLADAPPESNARLFRQGVIVSALNPKVAVFFLAFLPQFVDPERGAVALQIALLGVLFVVVATVLDCVWALAAGAVGERLRRDIGVRRWLDRLSGITYVGLGAAAALSRR